MAKLVVCGCSYSAPSQIDEFKGTHWSEILTKTINWELISLARQGCSNGGIRIQIDEAVKLKPDLVIVTPTYFDRIELPARISPTSWSTIRWKDLLSAEKIRDLLHSYYVDKSGYDPYIGIKNLNTSAYEPYRIVSENLWSLVSGEHGPNRENPVYPEVQDAIHKYVQHLYDPGWKKQVDKWLIRDGIQQLSNASIPFIIQPQNLWQQDYPQEYGKSSDQLAKEFFGLLLTDKNTVSDEQSISKLSAIDLLYQDGKLVGLPVDPGYHTKPLIQDMFATKLENYMINLGLLK